MGGLMILFGIVVSLVGQLDQPLRLTSSDADIRRDRLITHDEETHAVFPASLSADRDRDCGVSVVTLVSLGRQPFAVPTFPFFTELILPLAFSSGSCDGRRGNAVNLTDGLMGSPSFQDDCFRLASLCGRRQCGICGL
jgi:hypothetical protein